VGQSDSYDEFDCSFSMEQPLDVQPSDEIYDEFGRVQQSRDEELIRIGLPRKTFSGQGMSVHVEVIEQIHSNIQSNLAFEREEKLTFAEEDNDIPYILNYKQLLKVAKKGLPPSILFAKWTRLYSLLRDGDSFESSFLRKVQGHTRTLLLIHTTKNEIMAAYSNSAWENKRKGSTPKFYGSAQACLFSIDNNGDGGEGDDGSINVFKWSGSNRYIQVCDVQAKMLAFGGGGEEGEFGLCVENDFSTGSTGPCETFNNMPLCSEDQFDVMNVECWGFMPVFS